MCTHAHLMVLMNMSGNDSLENLPQQMFNVGSQIKCNIFALWIEITGGFFSPLFIFNQ